VEGRDFDRRPERKKLSPPGCFWALAYQQRMTCIAETMTSIEPASDAELAAGCPTSAHEAQT
jgi:hypothetical protein